MSKDYKKDIEEIEKKLSTNRKEIERAKLELLVYRLISIFVIILLLIVLYI